MAQSFAKLFKRARFAVAGTLFALSVVTAGAASLTHPTTAAADACDPVNIVYCGLDGRSLSSAINSFQADYNNGSNNGHHDLQTVYHWAGATDSNVANMNTSNTKLGTMYRNGDIKVNGTVVGHDAQVAARFGAGQPGFTQISSDAWARKTTTSLAEDTAPIIVHFDTNGNANYAVMIGCANAVKFVTVVQSHPALSCDNLTKDKVADRKFQFTASASAKDTNITKYVFDFGDGNSDTVRTNNQRANTSHSYDKFDHDYQVRVTVYSGDFGDGKTNSNCVVTAHTSPQPPTPPKPSLVCAALTETSDKLDYTFTASAVAKNTTITGYTFHFSDGTTKTVSTSAQKATLAHTFAQNNTAYTVFVTVKSTDLATTKTAACSLNLTTPKQNECKPGVPVGSPACNECKPGVPNGSSLCTECQPGVPAGSDLCVTPTPTPTATVTVQKLANTGPAGIFGLFTGVSGLGGLVHRILTRRKFIYLG